LRSSGSLVLALHRGEQQNISDRLAVGQEHGHAVDAEAEDGLTGHHGTKPAVAQGFSRFYAGASSLLDTLFLQTRPEGHRRLGATFLGSEKP